MPPVAHGHADLGGTQGRRIVDPIAGDRDEMAAALQGLDDRQLLLRRDPGEDACRSAQPVQHLRTGPGRLGDLGTGRDPIPVSRRAVHQIEVVGDASRRDRVIARHHGDLDAGTPAGLHGILGLRPRGVAQGHEAGEGHPPQLIRIEAVRGWGGLPRGKPQHPVTLPGQLLRLGKDLLADQRQRSRPAGHVTAHRHHGLHRPLDEDPDPLRAPVQGRGVAMLRLVGNGRYLSPVLPARLLGESGLVGEGEQGQVHTVAVASPGAVVAPRQHRLVSQAGGLAEGGQQVPVLVHGRPLGQQEDPLGHQALAGHLPGGLIGKLHPAHGELIHRQGPGLVGGDVGAGAQGLDRDQLADDDGAAGHAAHPDGQGHGDRHGQTLGDGGHGQRHREQEDLPDRRAAGELHDRHQERRDPHGQGDALGEVLHAQDQGRLDARLAGHRGGDAPELGAGPGCHDEPLGPPRLHQGPGEGHVGPIAENVRGPQGHGRVLLRGHGFPGQHGLVDGEVVGLQQPQVRGDLAPGLQQDDIARHQRVGVDLQGLAAPRHPGAGRHQPLQGLGRALRPELLNGADDGVDQQHREDEPRVRVLPQPEGDQGRDQQDIDQRALELAQKDAGQGGRPLDRQAVGAEVLEARRGGFPREPQTGAPEPLQRLRGREGVRRVGQLGKFHREGMEGAMGRRRSTIHP